ncbi:DUF3050 domain-containing protein [Dyadobacter psychrotolerans]|uniref:DUF3050 domain-containing protein n=1 Tax=Dyadobacter psychrotolerans TaxID=2541721 RepID=A0A4R5DA87_9BACT|nr:DUF3050 domain-containing protein [Dyadobacter psychrotolerans]TDE10516.1 DUF3050 domain-containing protein [Dyadobacter psychrotolerans]
MNQIENLKESTATYRNALINHRLYSQIKSLEDLSIFMESHVFAVWDFMSLLKVLQQKLTCVSVPWVPVGNAETRFLINEIVTGEESDVDQQGRRCSHFELYLDAMRQAGAGTEEIQSMLKFLQEGKSLTECLEQCGAEKPVVDFVKHTFSVIDHEQAHVQAAVFTFGREDLIPGMFISFVSELHEHAPESISIFNYYLQRHIEVDGDHHSHLAYQMTESLCGNDPVKWQQATTAVAQALNQRISLWDGIAVAIEKKQPISLNA